VQVLDGVARCGGGGRQGNERGNETNAPDINKCGLAIFGVFGVGVWV